MALQSTLVHKSTHATGGTDALSPADIGAAPNKNTPTDPVVHAASELRTQEANDELALKYSVEEGPLGPADSWHVFDPNSFRDAIGAEPTITTLPIAKGGTGSTTAANALTALGAEPAFTKQSFDFSINDVGTKTVIAGRRVEVTVSSYMPTGSPTLVLPSTAQGRQAGDRIRLIVSGQNPNSAIRLFVKHNYYQSPLGVVAGLEAGLFIGNSVSNIDLRATDGYWFVDTATTVHVQVFTSSGTWTKPVGAKSVNVTCIAGGSGGGSGRSSASGTAAGGGGGGAGGGRSFVTLDATLLAYRETVTIGAGGSGGASVAEGNGNSGIRGGDSSFGLWVGASYGAGSGAGGGGTNASGGSLGASGTRFMFASANGGAGGIGANGVQGGTAYVSGGGGGGGGINASGTIVGVGGNGGFSFSYNYNSGFTPHGTNGLSVPTNAPLGGNAGGGGTASVTANGNSGGNGGLYGAGGGGGGASQGFTSGAGGNGSAGIVVVTTYF